jgi:hypothetical protein
MILWKKIRITSSPMDAALIEDNSIMFAKLHSSTVDKIRHDVYGTYKTNKDSNGVFVTTEKKRKDGTLFMRSVLSGGTSPQYSIRTETYYEADGVTVSEQNTTMSKWLRTTFGSLNEWSKKG